MEKDLDDKIYELINAENFDEAKKLLDIELEKDENNIELKKLYALCEVNQGCYDSARYILEDIVKYQNEDALSWFYLGCCYDNLSDLISAKHAYLKVIELRSEYTEVYKSLSIVYIKLGEIDEAIDTIKKAIKFTQDDYALYYILGTAYMSGRKFEESIDAIKKAIELNPDNIQLYNNLGTSYLSISKYDEALDIYEKALSIDENDDLAYFNIASIYQIKNEHKKACDYFAKAYSLAQDDSYIIAWAVSEVKAGLYTEAIEHYKYLAAVYPQKDVYKYNLATCCDIVGEYKLAVAILCQLLMMKPKDTKIMKKLAHIYIKMDDIPNAKEIYERIVKQGSVSPSVYYELACLSMQIGDVDKAEQMLKKCCGLKPDFALPHKDLGVIYLNKRLFDYAKDEFELAYKYAPENPGILLEYANYLHAVSNFEKADEIYEEALALDKENINILAFSALNKTHINQIEEAKNRIDKVLQNHIHSAFLFFIAGRIYHLAKDYDCAKELLIKSYELEKIPDAESLLATCYMELGNYNQAKVIFKKMHEELPLNINISLNLAKCCEKLEEKDEALNIAELIVENFAECEEAQELIRRLS